MNININYLVNIYLYIFYIKNLYKYNISTSRTNILNKLPSSSLRTLSAFDKNIRFFMPRFKAIMLP